MTTFVKILAALPGVMMLMNGIMLVVQPGQAVESLGMTLQEGMGLSSQLGDTTAFFVGTALFIFHGAWKPEGNGLLAGALLLVLVAIFRVLATVLHGATFAGLFIGVELVSAAWLIGAWFYLRKNV